MDARAITEGLGGQWNATTGQGSALCPAHDDHHESLSISDGDKGKPVVYCHKGCTFESVRDELERRRLWPEPPPVVLLRPPALAVAEPQTNGTAAVAPEPIGPRRITHTYDYYDEEGVQLYQALRYEPKDFRQRQPDGRGGWIWSLKEPPVRRVLYRLPELLAAAPSRHVFIVEGEKDVERLMALGLVATTNPMGAGQWRPEFNPLFAGRSVVLLPDNDDVGRKHMEDVAAGLLPVAAAVRVVPLPGLPPKGDVSDWLSAGGSRGALEALVRSTEPLTTAPVVKLYPIQNLAALVRVVENNPAQIVEDMLWAERVHWAFAAPGAGKTLLLAAALMHVAAGREFCGRAVRQMPVLLIEEDSPFSVIAEYVDMLADIYKFDLENLPFWINQEQGLRLSDPEGPAMLYSAIEQCPERPGFLLLDACERLVPSDKFTSKELDPLVRLLQQLITEHITPGVIDHTRRPAKGEKGGGTVDLMELLYGGRSKMAISDVMMHFSGSPRDAMRITYAKFRGETPPPIDLTFSPADGFQLKAQPRKAHTPTEHKLLLWFNQHPAGTYGPDEIQAATGLSERSLSRALNALAQRHWLNKEGTTKQGVRFGVNPVMPAVFE